MQVLEAVPNMVGRRGGRIWSNVLHKVEARWFPSTVTGTWKGRNLLSGHRHVHNSELYRGEVYSGNAQMLSFPWFLQ